MNHENTEVKQTSGRSRAATIVGIILCVILIPILIVNVTMIVKSYIDPDRYPSFMGYSLMIVLSPSMEPTILEGDLIVVKQIDPSEVNGETSQNAGDGSVISFYNPESNSRTILTHRCVEVTTNADGKLAYRTKGDKNNTTDPNLVPATSLIGVLAARIPGAGNIAMWLQTIPGLVVCVALPIILLVAYDLIIKRRYEKTKATDTAALLAELDSLRAQAAEKDDESE